MRKFRFCFCLIIVLFTTANNIETSWPYSITANTGLFQSISLTVNPSPQMNLASTWTFVVRANRATWVDFYPISITWLVNVNNNWKHYVAYIHPEEE
jgi:hypothetical protein